MLHNGFFFCLCSLACEKKRKQRFVQTIVELPLSLLFLVFSFPAFFFLPFFPSSSTAFPHLTTPVSPLLLCPLPSSLALA